MKIFPIGLNFVELASAIRFFILSAILVIQVDSEKQVLDVFSDV